MKSEELVEETIRKLTQKTTNKEVQWNKQTEAKDELIKLRNAVQSLAYNAVEKRLVEGLGNWLVLNPIEHKQKYPK